ncbi:hypothetical protein PROFUN_13215 [Planoprotostelium fungivorum]|uniref:Uncharacterized protein n=1 Tax=Planoprotostelium fungivorum TaxID=1890364 RepID=A0A2P6MYT5_9EUKA|nr:hypothetical protein PROFUN_13215 [Planoprotostelium fungivorum]
MDCDNGIIGGYDVTWTILRSLVADNEASHTNLSYVRLRDVRDGRLDPSELHDEFVRKRKGKEFTKEIRLLLDVARIVQVVRTRSMQVADQ